MDSLEELTTNQQSKVVKKKVRSHGEVYRCKHTEIGRHELLFYHKVEGEGEAIDTPRYG